MQGHHGRFAGSEHNRWKEDGVGYRAIHSWLCRTFLKEVCEECPSTDQLEWANVSGEYLRDRSDYRVLCRSCHRKFDYAKAA